MADVVLHPEDNMDELEGDQGNVPFIPPASTKSEAGKPRTVSRSPAKKRTESPRGRGRRHSRESPDSDRRRDYRFTDTRGRRRTRSSSRSSSREREFRPRRRSRSPRHRRPRSPRSPLRRRSSPPRYVPYMNGGWGPSGTNMVTMPTEMLGPNPRASKMSELKGQMAALAATVAALSNKLDGPTASTPMAVYKPAPTTVDRRKEDPIPGPRTVEPMACTSQDRFSSDSESSQDESSRTAAGFTWQELASTIASRYPEDVPSDDSDKALASPRVCDLGQTTEKTDYERTRLPLFPAVDQVIRSFSSEIKNPPITSKHKKDVPALGVGQLPAVRTATSLPHFSPAGLPTFNTAPRLDREATRLLPSGKKTFSNQYKISEENLIFMVRNQRYLMSSLSYSLWCMRLLGDVLNDVSSKPEVDEDDLNLSTASLRHAMSHLSSTVERGSLNFASLELIRRDGFLSQMDNLLEPGQVTELRSAPFTDARIFSGVIPSVLDQLKANRTTHTQETSLKVLSDIAKDGMKKTPASTNNSTGGAQGKRYKQKRKPSGNKPAAGNTTTTTREGDNIKRSFRNEKKNYKKK